MAVIVAGLAGVGGLTAAEPIEWQVDFAKPAGTLRPLHGINKGPLVAGGMFDVTAPLRELGIPSIRLHDCHWPNPDVVDIHAIFPDFRADPADPASYTFTLTDEYIAAARETGARIIYRLGESIEHTAHKRFVHPPADPAKWAAVCIGIIRHYNEGWAGGFRHDIRHWEIWNEPENRPAMWSGTDEDYFRLYQAAAPAIKARFPALKVGGPAVGFSGEVVGGEFRAGKFLTDFLAFCRRESLPLDFLSWHCYTADPAELLIRARGIRALLDAHGFSAAESHLNEWNFLPGNSWDPLARTAAPEARRDYLRQMAGAPGAAFAASALLVLQDAPVTECNFFHGETGGFGLFSAEGVPEKSWHALRSFRRLLDTPKRVETSGTGTGRSVLTAGINEDGTAAGMLFCYQDSGPAEIRVVLQNVPVQAPVSVGVRTLDEMHNPDAEADVPLPVDGTLILPVKGPSVIFIRLTAGKAVKGP